MKICLILISLGVFFLHWVSCQRTLYVPDNSYASRHSARRHRSRMFGSELAGGYGRRARQYPSFQPLDDAYPAFSHRQTLPGHPYHSQRMRIKHSFPPASPPLNAYLAYGETPSLKRVLPHLGGYNRHLAALRLGQYGGQFNLQRGQFRGNIPRMNKLLPQYDAMDRKMLRYARQPGTVVVEKKIPVPYKVQVEKPYFVEVTKHVAIPVAVPVPKPMPYAVNKYIEVPKYVPVPSTLVNPYEQPRGSTFRPNYMSSPQSTPNPYPMYSAQYTQPSPIYTTTPAPTYTSTPLYPSSQSAVYPSSQSPMYASSDSPLYDSSPSDSYPSSSSPVFSANRYRPSPAPFSNYNSQSFPAYLYDNKGPTPTSTEAPQPSPPHVVIHPNGVSLSIHASGDATAPSDGSGPPELSAEALEEIFKKAQNQGAITLTELQKLMYPDTEVPVNDS